MNLFPREISLFALRPEIANPNLNLNTPTNMYEGKLDSKSMTAGAIRDWSIEIGLFLLFSQISSMIEIVPNEFTASSTLEFCFQHTDETKFAVSLWSSLSPVVRSVAGNSCTICGR